MTKGIITKTGNSYAIRVPMRYIVDNNLKLGDTVEVEEPLDKQQKALLEIVEYSSKSDIPRLIPDPVAWQREQRKSTSPWEEIKHDSSR